MPDDVPPPVVPSLTTATGADQPAYTSDGATYQPPPPKSVKWRDEAIDGGELTDAAQDTETAEEKPLTKTQRKKLRRKQRAELTAWQKTSTDVESEGEPSRPPARKASVHSVAVQDEQQNRKYNLRPRDEGDKAKTNLADWNPANVYEHLAKAKQFREETGRDQPRVVNGEQKAQSPAYQTTPENNRTKKNQASPHAIVYSGSQPLASPKPNFSEELLAALQGGYNIQVPTHVQHITSPLFKETVQQPIWLQPGSHSTPTKRSKALVIREGEDRNLALRLKLIHDFGQDKKWLTSPVQLANHTNSSNGGIHVFIDFSNIWIGFMNLLKRLNGLHPRQRSPHTNISFDSLVLLLERGRPVAKRTLAGSAPFLPAFDTAKAIGYELNILNRVFKAKELTERQRKFQANSQGDISAGSGSENMNAITMNGGPVLAPEKWVEQGVDEILHLKMLESIVDAAADAQGSTMVLATGDAAEAEYSAGFMKMVERALQKGWKVEIVGWKEGISFQYRKRRWLEEWGERFRIVELDDYAEFLLDT